MRTRAAAGRPASIRKAAAREVGSELFPFLAGHQTLEESADRDIRRAIVEPRFAPGHGIVASAVAQATEASRIPVMQALRLTTALEGLCVRESAGNITPALRARLHALQNEMAAAVADNVSRRAAGFSGPDTHKGGVPWTRTVTG
jgi:DNA-binding GntR family transcriptional regulator